MFDKEKLSLKIETLLIINFLASYNQVIYGMTGLVSLLHYPKTNLHLLKFLQRKKRHFLRKPLYDRLSKSKQ
jgi:hypothetical protein